jgi:hypothetical protein
MPSRWTRLFSPSFSIQPAQPVHLSGPAKPRHHLTHSISASWGPRVRAPFFTNPAWSPEPALRRRSHRNSAREEGAAGPPSRAEPARAPVAHPRGESTGGKDPCAPAGDAPGAVAATEGRPRRRARASSQSRSAGASMPSHRLDRASTSPRDQTLPSPTYPHWGFAPFQCPRRR